MIKLVALLLVRLVCGIGSPKFISDWIPIRAHGSDSEVEIVVPHNMSELPIKVDVQVRVEFNNTFFYFNAINSAQSGLSTIEYGGVIYMFNEENVKIFAPGPSNCPSCNGHIVYVGNEHFIGPPDIPRKFKEGHVRVRTWQMCTFRKPGYIGNTTIRNDGAIYDTMYHGLAYIDMLIVHVHLQNGHVIHAEGTSSVLMTTGPFGGIMFAYSHKEIRFWTPKRGPGSNDTNGVPFLAANGWGKTGYVHYDSEVTAFVFAFQFNSANPSIKTRLVESTKWITKGDSTHFDLNEILDVDNRFIYMTMSPQEESDIQGYSFFVPGSAMNNDLNEGEHYGGLVFGFSNTHIFIWQPPNDGLGCMIAVGGLWNSASYSVCSNSNAVKFVVIQTAHDEDACGGKWECSASRQGPQCDCERSGFEGQFCDIPISCSSPTDHNTYIVKYTPMIQSYNHNATIQFFCVDGYEFVNGSTERRCTYDKTWSGSTPVCERISCGDPDIAPYSKSSIVSVTSTQFQGWVNYICESGYGIAKGSAKRQCLASGNWSSSAPTCIISCGDPHDYGGVMRVDGGENVSGTFANYTCAKGYENFTGDQIRFCQMDGNWTGASPSCTIKYCRAPDLGNNSEVYYKTTFYQSTAEYICDEGFISSSDKITTALTSVCGNDKEWYPSPLDCERVTCPNPTPGINVKPISLQLYVYEDNVTYLCEVGYMLGSGDLKRECQANGTWSGNQPNCTDIECPRLGNITKGQIITTGLIYGSVAVAVCADGTAIKSGDVIRICDQTGTWTGTKGVEPVCEDVYQVFQTGEKNGANDTYDFSHLAVDVSALSRYKRSKRSVFYGYPSHVVLGTCGLLVIISVVAYICSLDCIKLVKKLENDSNRQKKSPIRKEQKVYTVYIQRK